MPRKPVRLALPACTRRFSALLVFLGALFALALPVHATITWSSGTNTVLPDTTQLDTNIIITGGTNTVLGLAGPPAGTTSGGTLRLQTGGTGLQITGATVTLNSDNTSPGTLLLQGNVVTSASSTTALITSGGSATVSGTVNLGSATRVFTLAAGSVPATGPDLSIPAKVTNGGLEKAGPGIIALSGSNTYTGGTLLDAGAFYINSSTAIGTGFFTINGPNTSIDNRSGGPLALGNNNQFNLTNGDLNFVGTNDLNLGSGIVVMLNADRAINVADAAATLTVGGRIQDAGQNLGLTKSGPGTLVLGGNNLYTGATNISGGTAVLNGSISGNVSVAANATFANNGTVGGNLSVSGTVTGAGTVHGSLVVNAGGTVDVSGGTFTVNGGLTNNGLFILSNGAQIAGVTGFINNGTLDLITAGAFNPPNFTNNGTIINSSAVKTKSVSRAGNNFSVTIDSYTGHTYQLQKSASPVGNTFSNTGSSQQGTTGTVLTLTDSSATASPSFYRIIVSP